MPAIETPSDPCEEIVIDPFSALIESALTVLVLTSWLNNSFALASEFNKTGLSLIPETIWEFALVAIFAPLRLTISRAMTLPSTLISPEPFEFFKFSITVASDTVLLNISLLFLL